MWFAISEAGMSPVSRLTNTLLAGGRGRSGVEVGPDQIRGTDGRLQADRTPGMPSARPAGRRRMSAERTACPPARGGGW